MAKYIIFSFLKIYHTPQEYIISRKRYIIKKGGDVTDITKLVEDLNTGIKSESKKSFGDKIYADVPIIRTASSLTGGDPPEYRLMRKLGNTLGYSSATEAVIFYEQAKYMENFEDDCEFNGDFISYFPTYRTMTQSQLRGYFTWRTRVRGGELRKGCTAYAFVYIYELINLIGCRDAADAFEKLFEFYKSYREFDGVLDRYVKIWLRDMAVYYGLPKEYYGCVGDTSFDGYLSVLLNYSEYDDNSLFEAMKGLSSFDPGNSRFYRDHPGDFRAVACNVYRSLSRIYSEKRKTSFCETVFGRIRVMPCTMFLSAVFYDRKKNEDRRYEIGPYHSYVCSGGKWLCYRCSGSAGKNTRMGAFLRNIDSLMRTALDYPYETRLTDCTKIFVSAAKKEIDAYYHKKAEEEKRRVTIDFSKLDKIRDSAAATRDMLMTEEELYDGTEDEAVEVTVTDAAEEQKSPDCPLNEAELEFLRILIAGGDVSAAAKKQGLQPSVIADAINEKLFELFSDNVIDFDGDEPVAADYYIEELKGLTDV